MAALDIEPAEWARLSPLLDEALELPAAGRGRWLDDLPPEHGALKPRLRALLAHAAQGEAGPLGTLPRIDASSTGVEAGAAGRTVGPYRLVRLLAEGGMGNVWLAERADGMLSRPVALKLPRGAWSRPGLLPRMAREREILASLEHSHIARLYDAGFGPDGHPYLALEYVEGRPIDAYARELGLDVRGRLGLFLQVAQAVAHAHARLVIHRDLKPSNILVTADGQVRLLDFGIAKLLEQGRAEETELTRLSGRALTLGYASPEQIEGAPLGVASDVYSLGVVLFELLAETRPYRPERDSPAALEEAILRADASRPSEVAKEPRFRKALRGDLDTIVLKALKKKPDERYPTVNALADDIERYLRGRPVLAQPDRARYRLRRFVGRNKLAVATGAALTLAVLGGAGAALWQAAEANRQRDAALQQQRRATAYSDFVGVLLRDVGPGDRALTPTALLEHGVSMLERQRALDESILAFMWYELSRNYVLFAQTDRALELLERSAAAAGRIGDHGLVAASRCSASSTVVHRDRAAAEALFTAGQRALLYGSVPADFAQAECLLAQARLLLADGKPERAIEVVEAGRARLARAGSSTVGRFHTYTLTNELSNLYRAKGRYRDALPLTEEVLRAVRDSGRSGSLAELLAASNHANNQCSLGEYVACAESWRGLSDWFEKIDLQSLLAPSILINMGEAFLEVGEPEAALAAAEANLAVAERSGRVAAMAKVELLAARGLLQLGRAEGALRRLERAEAIRSRDSRSVEQGFEEGELLRAELLFRTGELAGARRSVEALLERAGDPRAMDPRRANRLLRAAARIELRAGDGSSAERLAALALEIASRVARTETSSADVGTAALLHAEALVKLGRAKEAAADAERALPALRNGAGPRHPNTIEAQQLLRHLRPNSGGP